MIGRSLWLSALLLEGYDAKVVGGEPTPAALPDWVCVDGHWSAHTRVRYAAPGVLVTRGDQRILFASHDRDAAERLLERAYAELDEVIA